MKNEQWEAIHTLFEKIKDLCEQPERPAEPVFSESREIVSDEQSPANLPATKNYDIVRIREEIRKELDLLRVKLAEQLAERDCYLVIFEQ